MKTHRLTKQKLENLQSELHNLINVERPKVIKEIQEARSLGDLSENADYDSAKNRQSFLEGRISEIEEITKNYVLIDEASHSSNVVELGTKVMLKDMSEDVDVEYEILGTIDNDPENFKISNESPLAKALIGKAVGEVAEVVGIPNSYKVKILKIS